MLVTIQPSALTGEILAPASKSSMQRACAAALLRTGETIIHHPGYSNDDKAALGVIRDLGAEVSTQADGSLLVVSKGAGRGATGGDARVGHNNAGASGLEVNCGESGLGLRMFAPIIALSGEMIRVKGEGSLLSRPMDFFDEIFPQLGIRVVSNKGKLPLEIQGPLRPANIAIDGSLSSQFLTGLLLAYVAAGAKDVTIRVHNLKSKPYIDLTLQVMDHFGWKVENRHYEEFYFPGEPNSRANGGALEYTVEGDWSGGAFLLVAGAIAGPIVVRGLDVRSTQADKAILQALRDSGASLMIGEDVIGIGPAVGAGLAGAGPAGSSVGAGPAGGSSGRLQAFHFDATDCPDLFPPLVALASQAEGTTVIAGVSRLAHKESNRGLTLQQEFGKMGVGIDLVGDKMLIRGGGGVSGGGGIKGGRVHSRHDHRIAMACAVGALKAEGEVIIEDAEAIDKSYPDFYRHLQELGGSVKI